MSRLAKRPIAIPEKVKVTLKGHRVTVDGPLGSLSQTMPAGVEVIETQQGLLVNPPPATRRNGGFQGLAWALLRNMINGVVKGFEKKLEINGVGYKAELKGRQLILSLGLSHLVYFPVPKDITVKVTQQTQLLVQGIDKELVGIVAARIKSFRPVEPYKGKGVTIAGERVIRKAGKTGSK